LFEIIKDQKILIEKLKLVIQDHFSEIEPMLLFHDKKSEKKLNMLQDQIEKQIDEFLIQLKKFNKN